MIKIKFLSGSKSDNDSYIGDPNTITVDFDNKSIRLHDGNTPGGSIISNDSIIQSKIDDTEVRILSILKDIITDLDSAFKGE